MKKLLLLFLLILIVGCGQAGPRQGEKLTGAPDGLNIEFLQLQPPAIIREGQDINVGLKVTNKGVCEISSQICVTDTLSSVWAGIDEQCQSLTLKGISLAGGRVNRDSTELRFNFEPYRNLDRELSTTVVAKSRYNCDVLAGPQLCVKNLVGENEKQCSSFETVTGDNLKATIAPITLSKVDKQLVPQGGGVNLITDITLKKMAQGEIAGDLDQSVVNERGETIALRYVPVRIEADYGGYTMQCNNVEDGIFLWNKENTEETINCELFLGSVSAFENNPLNVRMSYEYENFNSFNIKITDVNNQR